MIRSIDWQPPATVVIIDQTRLPEVLATLEIRSVRALTSAIERLAVRGAPALGVAGALGVALAYAQAEDEDWDESRLAAELAGLRDARPTAVNLAWAVDRMLEVAPRGRRAIEEAALELLEADIDACHAIGERGADELAAWRGSPLRLQTHCNAGALACVEWGTALGVVRSLHRRGLVRNVLVDETRPLLQGSRLTAFELEQEGVPHQVIVDGAGPGLIASGEVDAVVVGADRIAANGDVANKVGTYPLALACARAGIPFVVAAPESTFDAATPNGAAIPIEERAADEVLGRLASPGPSGVGGVRNPAFDVTPADLVTVIVTERRLIRSPATSLGAAAPIG